MANLYVKAVPPADLNRNTEWFMYPGVWTTYILILFFAWLLVLSVFGCSPGMAWTVVNLSHFAVCASIFLRFFCLFWSGFLLPSYDFIILCEIVVDLCNSFIWFFCGLVLVFCIVLCCFSLLQFNLFVDAGRDCIWLILSKQNKDSQANCCGFVISVSYLCLLW